MIRGLTEDLRAASNKFTTPSIFAARIVSHGASLACPPIWTMPSQPSTRASTSALLDRSQYTNSSCDAASPNPLRAFNRSVLANRCKRVRQTAPNWPFAPVIRSLFSILPSCFSLYNSQCGIMYRRWIHPDDAAVCAPSGCNGQFVDKLRRSELPNQAGQDAVPGGHQRVGTDRRHTMSLSQPVTRSRPDRLQTLADDIRGS